MFDRVLEEVQQRLHDRVPIHLEVRQVGGHVDLDRVSDHFAARCRAVVRLPFDPHLEEGAEIELDKLAGSTRAALLELAATVADDFGRAGSRVRRPVIPR